MSAKILIIDIETSPIISYTWGLFDQTIGLNMIQKDWGILAVSAKWIGDSPSKMFYMDQRNVKDISNDSKLLKEVWKLLDAADIVIGQNSSRFDIKKLFSRFILNGMQPPSSFKQIDTLAIARKKFEFTSNRLEYLSEKLCTKYRKQTKRKFSGFELWKECLKGNKKAWKEMEKYNKYDVLATEELYTKLIPWDSTINFSLYNESENHICSCGSVDFIKNGFHYTSVGKFQRYKCKECSRECRDRTNLFSKEKKKSIKVGLPK